MTKRAHAELIKQWADGAVIQFLDCKGKWVDTFRNTPTWYAKETYRVKPTQQPYVQIESVTLTGYAVDEYGNQVTLERKYAQHDRLYADDIYNFKLKVDK